MSSENKQKKAKTGASSKKSSKTGSSGDLSSSVGHTSPVKPVTQVFGEPNSPTGNGNSNDSGDSSNHESPSSPDPKAPGSILREILDDLGHHGTLSMADKSRGKLLLIEAARESFMALENSWQITNALELLEHYDLLKSDLQENKRNSGRYELLMRSLSLIATRHLYQVDAASSKELRRVWVAYMKQEPNPIWIFLMPLIPHFSVDVFDIKIYSKPCVKRLCTQFYYHLIRRPTLGA